ncbi:MAG: hypothetical protein NXH85_02730 [Pseudomonadaceae bacterium]|nr:hypothetical protein [Pseudomonadaceae bacterium]
MPTNQLELDAETQRDLDLFEPEGSSLFSYCDHCRTDAGRRALRQRMETPSSDRAQIAATQQALVFINNNRDCFRNLPSEYVALNTERYITSAYPGIHQRGAIEFHIAAFVFWRNDDQFYTKIVRGEAVTRRYIGAMRRLCEAVDQLPEATTAAAGELAPLLREASEILKRQGLSDIREDIDPKFHWAALRMDQVLRQSERDGLTRLLTLAAEFDALVSLADVVQKNGLVMPDILEGDTQITAQGLVHPLLSSPVPNPVDLHSSQRLLFLTGPNMAGKTTYLRTLATAIYLAHLGMGVPATRLAFAPLQRLMTAISLQDDLSSGVSYFRAEALRMRAIAEAVASGRSTLAVLDEPFKGTNVKDAYDATKRVLHGLAGANNGLFVVTSHLIEISDELKNNENVAFGYFEASEGGDTLTFDFALREGVSTQRLGMRVLKEEGVFELLDRIMGTGPSARSN